MFYPEDFFKEKFIIPARYQYMKNYSREKPIGFGYKTFWCTVKTTDTQALLKVLKFKKLQKCDWVEGMITAYEGGVFILPPISGWSIIHGWGLPTPLGYRNITAAGDFLNSLSEKFDEAQMMGSFRGSGSVCWMLSKNGDVERFYSQEESHIESFGEPTEIENQWNLPENIDDNRGDVEYAGEDDPLEVAESWSVNPMAIGELQGIGTFGYRGILDL